MSKEVKNNSKVKFGLGKRIIAVVIISVLYSTAIFLWNAIPKTSDKLSDEINNNVYNLSMAYGQLVENLVKDHGTLTTEQYAEYLSQIEISGYDSSYAYLCDSKGTMMYHPTESKIGDKVENVVVSGLVEDLAKGIVAEPDVIEYEYNGVMKIAGYYISEADQSILVVTMDKDQIEEGLSDLFTSMILAALLAMALSVILAFFVSRFLAKPLVVLSKVTDNIANLDLTQQEELTVLTKRTDEAGLIANSMQKMIGDLAAVVNDIANTSQGLSKNAEHMKEITETLNENSSDNSATSEQLAASMQETSATTDAIDGNVSQIETNVSEINQLTANGSSLAKEIIGRAEALKRSSQDANDRTLKIYADVKEKTEIAILQSKAVEKIQNLTDAIMAIASQTSLLSLNASIEAARAGEMGRGFAVVAGEIGNLASQSTATVNNITQIVTEVQTAVNNMAECLTETLEFLDKTVRKDYVGFVEVGDKYSEDAAMFEESMRTIHESANVLSASIDEISTAISGINATIGEAATGVSDIADKTSNTVMLTADVANVVADNTRESESLSAIVAKFKL